MRDINKSVAITGHRIVKKDFSLESLEKEINILIDKGYKYFYVGMALGFDSLCFEVLYKIKQEKNIEIIACLPCKDQDALWNKVQKENYRRNLEKADEIITISEKYDGRCMNKRNCFMVDKSSVLIAYVYKTGGGSYNTVKYAVEKGKEIVYIK